MAAVAQTWPRADEDVIVIGSDQVADLDGQPLGKPGTHERALAQLRAMRGRTVHFHTAVSVLRPRTGFDACELDSVAVTFRELSDEDIETYLRLEQPYDCAGSAKCEGLGISLLARIGSDDPTSLIGLPLILTTRLLRQAGLDVLAAQGLRATFFFTGDAARREDALERLEITQPIVAELLRERARVEVEPSGLDVHDHAEARGQGHRFLAHEVAVRHRRARRAHGRAGGEEGQD